MRKIAPLFDVFPQANANPPNLDDPKFTVEFLLTKPLD